MPQQQQQQQQWFNYNTKAVALLQQNRYKDAAKLLRKGIQLVLEACRAQEQQDQKRIKRMMMDRRRAYDNNNASFSAAIKYRLEEETERAGTEQEGEEEDQQQGEEEQQQQEQEQSSVSVPGWLPSLEQCRQRRKSLNDLEEAAHAAAAVAAGRHDDDQEDDDDTGDQENDNDSPHPHATEQTPGHQSSLVMIRTVEIRPVDWDRPAVQKRLATSPDQIFTLFHRAFVLRSSSSNANPGVPRWALPVVLFNAGLAYHHRGCAVAVEAAGQAPNVRPANKHWQTALRFYDMALKSVQHDHRVRQAWQERNHPNHDDFYQHDDDDDFDDDERTRWGQPASPRIIPETLLLLACANNMGHIFSHSLQYEESKNCCEMIRTLLAPLADLDQAERERRQSSRSSSSSSSSSFSHLPCLHQRHQPPPPPPPPPGEHHDDTDPDTSKRCGGIRTTSHNRQHQVPLKEPEHDLWHHSSSSSSSSSRQSPYYQYYRKEFAFFSHNVFFQNSPRVLLVPAAA